MIDWITGVRDSILTPLAHEDEGRLGSIAEGYGQSSVKILELLRK